MKNKYNIWHIDAYSGWSDYDDPKQCNIHRDIIMDSTFSKEDVVEMFSSLLTGRSTAIENCEIVEAVEINSITDEQLKELGEAAILPDTESKNDALLFPNLLKLYEVLKAKSKNK